MDICFMCSSTHATITFNCSHRLTCEGCYQEMVRRSNGQARCPQCRVQIMSFQHTYHVQLCPATIVEPLSRSQYPFGALLFDDQHRNRILGDHQAYNAVREACIAVRAGELSYEAFRAALATRLTVSQREMALVELHNDINFHSILQNIDQRLNEKATYQGFIRKMTMKAVHDADNTAIALRAGIQTAIGIGAAVYNEGLYSLSTFTKADCIGGIVVFCVLASLEVYRCARGELALTEMAKNVGEHAVGTSAGIGGAFVAATAVSSVMAMKMGTSGATVGASLGPAGAIIGFLVGAGLAFGADYFARKGYRYFLPSQKEQEEQQLKEMERQQTPEEIARRAATYLGIDISAHSMHEAQTRYRRKLLSVHPGKHPNATDEEKERFQEETRTCVSCWAIVRQHYIQIGREEQIEEAFVIGKILRAWDPVENLWKIVRTWFTDIELGRDIDPQMERIETVTVYL